MFDSSPTLALYAKEDGIHLRITAKSSDYAKSMKIISAREEEIRRILKDAIWGTDRDKLEVVTGSLLIQNKLSLSTADSFSGGYLSYLLSTVPESGNFYMGGIVVNSDSALDSIGLRPFEESRKPGLARAAAMAKTARLKFDTDIGIGIDGSMEVENDVPSSKAYIAIDCTASGLNSQRELPGRPLNIIRRTAMQALFDLRKTILSR